MVGIPGKSKGCHTCRRRKIRCDQDRPTCGQCRKSHRTCEGYEKQTLWVNKFAKQHDSEYLNHGSVELTVVDPFPKNKDDLRRDTTATADGRAIRLENTFHDAQVQPGKWSPSVPRLIGFEHLQSDQALHKFLSCSLPGPGRSEWEVPLLWLYSVPSVANDCCALPLAVSALSYGWAGHVEESPELVVQARSFYGSALRHLHQMLSDDSFSQSDTILATMGCLALYEMFESGTMSAPGWLTHLSAVETVIRLRGSQMHIGGFGYEMFAFFRTISIFESLIRRKASFLSTTEWKHTPWTLQAKNTFHKCLDLAAEVPVFLERADSFTEPDSTSTESDHLAYLRDCVSMLNRLEAWTRSSNIKMPAGPPTLSPPSRPGRKTTHRQEFIYSSRACSQIAPSETQRRHSYPSKTPQALGTTFDTLQSSRLMCCLWMVELVLYQTVYENEKLRRCLGDSVMHDGSFECLSRHKATGLARKLALWSDFCTQNAWQSFGPVLASYLLRSTIRWFEFDKESGFSKSSARHSCARKSLHASDVDVSYAYQAELDKCLDLLSQLPSSKFDS